MRSVSGRQRSRPARRHCDRGSRTSIAQCSPSVPYCAVGCGQLVYVKDGEVIQIEGDPASPISRGRLCPKGRRRRATCRARSASTRSSTAARTAREWEELSLDAGDGDDRRARDSRRAPRAGRSRPTPATRPTERWRSRNLGGATLDNEENYLIKKLCTASASSRSRTRPAYDTALRSPVWGPRSGGAARPTSSRICRTPTAS